MSLLVNNCQRLTSLTRTYLRLSAVSSQFVHNETTSKKYLSKKWPGYRVIYNLDNVKLISILNRIKLQITVISGIAIPVVTLLEANLLLTSGIVHNVVFMRTIATSLHLVGYFTNNIVGIIYVKTDSEDVKIAYVSYFGKRNDIDTCYDDITCSEPKSRFSNSLYTQLLVESQKKKLKLVVPGKIVDREKFNKLLGITV